MSVPFEKELENVARHWAKRGRTPLRQPLQTFEWDVQNYTELLRADFMELLEAGQAMRDWWQGVEDCPVSQAAEKWDAARERLAQLEKR